MIAKSKEYGQFLEKIKEKIRSSQYEALKAVNKELINLYWEIGKSIVEQQEKYGWGKSIVETLANDLQKEYPGIQGFSVANIWRMKNFFVSYSKNVKLAPLVREISWSKNIIIFEKCKEGTEREFYIKMTRKFGWTKDVLIHQIENKLFEKYLLNQTNYDTSLPEKYKNQAKLAVKDEYTFDFLELNEDYSERELEAALMNKIRKFLIEMGGNFCFIGNQFRLDIEGYEFFIDILLYHRTLRCLVAIDLKLGEFKPEFAGKMQFYLSVLDDKVKLSDENSSIGIIICKNKNRTVVEYALKDTKKPIGVSTYNITQELPKNLSKLLPSKEDLIKSIDSIL